MTAPTPTPVARLLYDRKEAARMLSISIRALDYLVADKKLRTIRKGKKVMFAHAELARHASSNDYRRMTPPKCRRRPAFVIALPSQTWGIPA